jgi:hypothetical protein
MDVGELVVLSPILARRDDVSRRSKAQNIKEFGFVTA